MNKMFVLGSSCAFHKGVNNTLRKARGLVVEA